VTYRIAFSTAAARRIRKLPNPVRVRVLNAVEALEEDPCPHGVRKLVGEATAWRIRVGDYRVIYDISDDRLSVTVVHAGHRRDIHDH
jgi:mRNA interferase RelE/StbE